MDTGLAYPFDPAQILKKRRAIRRRLLSCSTNFIDKKIAVLGGSTTHDICEILELYLLEQGIRPTFYQSDYGQYWQDAMFGSPALDAFKPDIIFIHTGLRNLAPIPSLSDSTERVEEILQENYIRFEAMWKKLSKTYACPIIQNNFELPFYRLLGNSDASNVHGLVHFCNALNTKFSAYAAGAKDFYIHDILYLQACYGLDKWSNPLYWHLYKYALAPTAIPAFAASLGHIIASLMGKNKKVLVLDLDNTLWGGVVGDDGVEGLALGPETPKGQIYSEFQSYIKSHKELGVLLAVCSKNEEANALAGLNHPDSVIRPEDFVSIQANWEPKDRNLGKIADELSLFADSFVFVDDNPAEREIVRQSSLGASVPEIGQVEQYILALDRNGYFEATQLSVDDTRRTEMYTQNRQRQQQETSFADYDSYLQSLQMQATIRSFEAMYLPRIAQLTNKSNQFNLTTKRYTQPELESLAANPEYITLYGKLTDKFGENGVVSVVAGRIAGEVMNIDLWLMSCRVLRRGMEDAMMNTLLEKANAAGVKTVLGYYYSTPKNAMVQNFYKGFGFVKTLQEASGDSVWSLSLAEYLPKEHKIKVETK